MLKLTETQLAIFAVLYFTGIFVYIFFLIKTGQVVKPLWAWVSVIVMTFCALEVVGASFELIEKFLVPIVNLLSTVYFGQFGLAFMVGTAGLCAFAFKRLSPWAAGLVEIAFGLVSAFAIGLKVIPVPTPAHGFGKSLAISDWTALASSAYIVTRGLNNIYDAGNPIFRILRIAYGAKRENSHVEVTPV
jgi:hypothetical protein